jgi:hypothetical protein
LFNLISSVFPDWTDTSVANFGNLMVELFASVGDELLYYQDNQAKESRLTDATLRKSVLAAARMLGYNPHGASAATAEVLASVDRVPLYDIVIPDSLRVLTADVTDPVSFRFSLTTTIPAGSDPAQVLATMINSEEASDSFVSTDLPNQEIKLTSGPFVDGTETVTADGLLFELVDDLFGSSATDRHYTLRVENDDRARIRFGNGASGAIPTGDIQVDYEVGGGAAGNVEAGTIERPSVSSVLDTQGNSYTLTVTNSAKASGGLNRETLAQIKQRAPLSARLTNRTVSLEDYEIGAEEVPGVARALMATADQAAGIPENRGKLFIVTEDGGTPTHFLKDEVLRAVTETRPNTITFQLEVLDPSYLAVDINAVVFLASGFTEKTTRANIEESLEAFFAIRNADGTINDSIKFGLQYKVETTDLPEIPLSDITNAVRDSAGVRKLGDNASDFTVNGNHSDVTIGNFDLPVLGTITLRNGFTGDLF